MNFSTKEFLVLVLCLPLAYGLVIHCNYSDKTWPRLGKVYTCEAKVLNSELKVESALMNVTGTHKKGKSNSSVRFLSINDTLQSIPSNVDKIFSKLKGVQMWHASLKALSADDLQQFPNLEVLIVPGNNLVTLDADLFRFNRKLQWIDFRNNSIEQVGADILKKLSNLKDINFSRNPCINVHAKSSKAIKALMQQLMVQCPIVKVTSSPVEESTATKSNPQSSSESSSSESSSSESSEMPATEPSTEPSLAPTTEGLSSELPSNSTSSEAESTQTTDNEMTTTTISPLTTEPTFETTNSPVDKDEECSSACAARMEKLLSVANQKVSDLLSTIESLQVQLTQHKANYETRFTEIEMQLRELWSTPCTSRVCP